MLYLSFLIVVIVIGVIVRAVRASNRRAETAGFQSYATTAKPAFPLQPGEAITLSVAARDLGAARRLAGDAITDEYPGSFPLVSCTSTRLVIQMSVTDRTTDLVGTYPPKRPDLRHRIGEQFAGADRRVSSCEWPWQTISSIVAEGDTVALLWGSQLGSGAAMLTFNSVGDQARFLTVAVAAIAASRTRADIVPPEPTRTVDDGSSSSEFDFPGAQIFCSDCGTVILTEDRFCTGCGERVFRLEPAGS
jgi:hypothetical protein